jgi:tRNA(Ile)-lysidine synthase
MPFWTTNEPMVSVVAEGLAEWDYIAAPEALTHKMRMAMERFDLLRSGETVVVGVSGGPDSLTLLHGLWRLQKEFNWQLIAAHLNHGLRGADADADEDFVRSVCERWGILCVTQREDVQRLARAEKLSVAQAGRRARYRFFAQVAQAHGATTVALGHTASDVVETMLLNLFRGTGLEGLQGIPPKSPLTLPDADGRWRETGIWLVRPLIFCWRVETETYARVYRLQPRTDASNFDLKVARNWVRWQLLPLLRQRFPQVDGALWRLSELAREQGEFLKALAKEWLKEWGQRRGEPPWETIAVPREAFLALPKALRRQVFRQMVEAMAGALNEVSFEHTEQALNLIARHSDQAMLHLPERLVVRLERGMILLAKMPSFAIGAS